MIVSKCVKCLVCKTKNKPQAEAKSDFIVQESK